MFVWVDGQIPPFLKGSFLIYCVRHFRLVNYQLPFFMEPIHRGAKNTPNVWRLPLKASYLRKYPDYPLLGQKKIQWEKIISSENSFYHDRRSTTMNYIELRSWSWNSDRYRQIIVDWSNILFVEPCPYVKESRNILFLPPVCQPIEWDPCVLMYTYRLSIRTVYLCVLFLISEVSKKNEYISGFEWD